MAPVRLSQGLAFPFKNGYVTPGLFALEAAGYGGLVSGSLYLGATQ